MPLKVDGVDYTPEGIEELREEAIKVRDVALVEGEFQGATFMTHIIALLAYLKEIVESDNKD